MLSRIQHSKKLQLTSTGILCALLLAGCQSPGLKSEPVTLSPLPEQWTQALGTEADTMKAPDNWVASFGDPVLKRLVDESIANNLQLKVALARLESSRQVARISSSQQLPSLSLEFSSSVTERNGALFDAYTEDSYRLSVGTAWEADLWGRVRQTAASGKLEWHASEYDLVQAKHSIAAAVCASWYNLVAAKQQLDLARATAESYEKTANLIRDRYESGIDSALDYRLAAANAENAKSSVSQQEEIYKRSQRSLQVLLGRYPDGSLSAGARFPSLSRSMLSELSSDLLNRRPDIRAADRRLAAAEASMKSASRDRLPKIMLTGSTGTQTEDFKEVMDANFDFWTVGASLNQPLFDGGLKDAAFKQAKAFYDQARLTYQQSVLDALFEVEQALEADKFFKDLVEASLEAAKQSEGAEELAWEQYSSGIINIVTVLESQRLSLNAKRSYIGAQNSRIQNRIQLYLALGGDI